MFKPLLQKLQIWISCIWAWFQRNFRSDGLVIMADASGGDLDNDSADEENEDTNNAISRLPELFEVLLRVLSERKDNFAQLGSMSPFPKPDALTSDILDELSRLSNEYSYITDSDYSWKAEFPGLIEPVQIEKKKNNIINPATIRRYCEKRGRYTSIKKAISTLDIISIYCGYCGFKGFLLGLKILSEETELGQTENEAYKKEKSIQTPPKNVPKASYRSVFMTVGFSVLIVLASAVVLFLSKNINDRVGGTDTLLNLADTVQPTVKSMDEVLAETVPIDTVVKKVYDSSNLSISSRLSVIPMIEKSAFRRLKTMLEARGHSETSILFEHSEPIFPIEIISGVEYVQFNRGVLSIRINGVLCVDSNIELPGMSAISRSLAERKRTGFVQDAVSNNIDSITKILVSCLQ